MFEPVLRFCRKTFGYRTECKVYATAMKKTSSNDNTVISSSSPTAEVEADDAVHGFDNDDDLTFDTSDEVVTVDHKHKTTGTLFDESNRCLY